MCLGIPGQVIAIEPNALGMTMGKVSFGGVVKEICLAYVPQVKVGAYVIAHAGFALGEINEPEASQVFATLQQIDARDWG